MGGRPEGGKKKIAARRRALIGVLYLFLATIRVLHLFLATIGVLYLSLAATVVGVLLPFFGRSISD